MNSKRVICSALVLAAGSGFALAQAVDGKITNPAEASLYGAPKWVQNVTTGFGNAGPSNPCDSNGTGGDPATVTTGMEFKIPLSSLGKTDSGAPAGTVRLTAIINNGGHNYMSNQVLPPLPAGAGNLGGDGNGNFTGTCADINFANIAGTQYASVNLGSLTLSSPAANGMRDAAYGAPIAVQVNRTGFGNATNGTQAANGSELDAMYVAVDSTYLYVFLAGNLESNFNKVELFIDSPYSSSGQNQLSTINPWTDGGDTSRLGGMRFDAGFEADYHFTFGCGGNPVTFYPNFMDLVAQSGSYLGCNQAGNGIGTVGGCGGNNPAGFEIALDNTNAAGVGAPCPPPAGNADTANGSEIDAVFSYIADGKLHLLITGNIESGGGTACDEGGNKLMLFVDADGEGAGQGTLRADNVDIAYGALNRMAGMTFDSGFAADYFMSVKTGGSPAYMALDAAVLRTDGKRRDFNTNALDYGAYDGGTKADYNPVTFRGNFVPCNGNPNDPAPQDGFTANIYTNYAPRAAAESLMPDPLTPTGTPGLIKFSINNSNFGGVEGSGGSVSDAANVTTGTEVVIDLTELGWDGSSCIKLAGFVVNNNGTYGSNQVIGGLPDQNYGNLGSQGNMSTINFNNIAGQQWIVVAGDCGGGNTCPPCAADFNDDGGVDGADIEAFFVTFGAGESCADVNQDGGVDGADVEAFFAVFSAGGC